MTQLTPIRSATGSVLLGLFVLIAGSCNRTRKVEAETSSAAGISTVAVAKVTKEALSHNVILTAEFRPFQEIDVMAKVSGYVKEIKVDVGDRVQQGQLLATLEIPEMINDLTRARAAVERSSAEVARARDEVQRAESAHKIAHLSYERLAASVNSGPDWWPSRRSTRRRGRTWWAKLRWQPRNPESRPPCSRWQSTRRRWIRSTPCMRTLA